MTRTQESGAWEGRAIALLDLDAFFASVEQLDHPEYRNKPLIVGGQAGRRGVVATCSYEARAFGVHSAMSSYQATKLCPHAIFVSGNYDRYLEVSHQVMQIIFQHTPLVQQVSIDEAFFDITPSRYTPKDPVEVCKQIQAAVDALGITCSIGLANNKATAKIASDMHKPHGLTVVYPGYERSFMSDLPISRLSGIGPVSGKKLIQAGVTTIGELADAPHTLVSRLLGAHGTKMQRRAQGIDDELDLSDEVKSISNERTFVEDLTSLEEVEAALHFLAHKVCMRLRVAGLQAFNASVHVRYAIGSDKRMQRQLPFGIDDEKTLATHLLLLLNHLWQPGQHIRLLGVEVSKFEAPDQTPSIFDLKALDKQSDHQALAKVTDQVKEKFGDDKLLFGHELRFKGKISDTATANRTRFIGDNAGPSRSNQ